MEISGGDGQLMSIHLTLAGSRPTSTGIFAACSINQLYRFCNSPSRPFPSTDSACRTASPVGHAPIKACHSPATRNRLSPESGSSHAEGAPSFCHSMSPKILTHADYNPAACQAQDGGMPASPPLRPQCDVHAHGLVCRLIGKLVNYQQYVHVQTPLGCNQRMRVYTAFRMLFMLAQRATWCDLGLLSTVSILAGPCTFPVLTFYVLC